MTAGEVLNAARSLPITLALNAMPKPCYRSALEFDVRLAF
jgi:hypothetical protein